MIGSKFSDRYEIVSELGRGGMGVVYRAHDPMLNREVAIKVVAPELLTPETAQRFQTEAQLVAQMDHPSIVSIHDFGRHEGSMFFVMPIIEGESLRHYLREGGLRLGTVVDLGIEVAEALEYSHSRKVIHRDIKPENIMAAVDESGGVRVRIMDFGLARGTNVSSLTKTGMLVGTMSYISPEQVMSGAVDGRSDIYSLGCVLYESVINEVPFAGEMQSVLYRVVHEVPQSPRELGADIDPELEAILLDCLAKSPGDRPQTAGELATALRRYKTKMRDSQRLQSVLLTRTMQAPRPALSPLIGREQEFSELQRRLNAATRNQCQFVVVSGEPGVGKTRLLDELETLSKARQIRVLHGRFVEKGGAFPYNGFCEAIQDFYQQKETGSSASGLPDLSELATDLISLFPMLGEIEPIRSAASGGSKPAVATEARSPENRTQVFELLARTLTLLGGGQPLVLVFEDLHGADVSLEALQYIVHRMGPTPTLLVGSYQSTEVDRRHPLSQMLEGFQGDRRFALVNLESFGAQEHRQFLTTLTAGSEIADNLAKRLFEATEGNPFFTKELVRSLVDAGSIAQDETGSWKLSGSLEISSDALPATIQQAVERRIGSLPAELRRILSIASVMGKTFEFDDLEKLVPDAEDLDDAVDSFIQAGLIEEDRQSRGDRLTFSSVVVREVLYAELPRRKRRSLHRKFADRLERRHAGRLERVYSQLLYHFSEGDELAKTVEYGLLHARRSLDSFSPDEVIRAAKLALDFLDEDWEGDPTTEAEVRLLLAEGHRLAGDINAGLQEIEKAIEVFERQSETERALAALLTGARTAWAARHTDEARRWTEKGVDAARSSDQPLLLGEFLSLAATLANLRGEYAKGTQLLQEAESLLESSQTALADQVQDDVPTGGNLIVALGNTVAVQSPVESFGSEESEVLANIFETLLGTDEDGNLLPMLCQEWEMGADARTLRLHLRPDVTFHDGEALTAQVVKESFEHAVRISKSDQHPAFASIRGALEMAAGEAQTLEGVVAKGDHELEIELSGPLPIYPVMLTDFRAGISKQATSDDASAMLLGTGPFKWKSSTADNLVLERYDDYWQGSSANLDSIEFRISPNAAAIATGFRSGDFDLAQNLLPEDLEQILHDPRYHDSLIEKPEKFTYFVLFNTRSGPHAHDPALRQAMSEVVRARDLVWEALGRFAAPATGLIPPGILGHDPGRRRSFMSLEEAKQTLEKGGFEGPLKLKAAVHPIMQDRYSGLLNSLISAWGDLGIEIEITTTDMASFREAYQDNEGLDLLIGRWRPDINDPDNCTYRLFHSTGFLCSYFCTPETDEILTGACHEMDPIGRENGYRKFEDLLLESHSFVPLFHDVGYRLVGPKVRNAKMLGAAPYVNYPRLGKTEEITTPSGIVAVARGTIQVAMRGIVEGLDPALETMVEEAECSTSVFETLVRDVGESRIEPWLAASCRVEDAGKRYVFRLRDGITFHNGRRLTARDVRFSLERLLRSEESDARWMYAPIRGARALLEGEGKHLEGFKIHSATEFSIELEHSVPFFLGLLACPNASILPEGTTTVGNSLDKGMVGTGPFQVASFEPGVRLELKRFPKYWRQGFPKAENLVFSFDNPPERIVEDFRAGRLSMASELYPADVETLRRDPEYAGHFFEMPRLSSYFAGFNNHRGPCQDRALRQKLVRAVDVRSIIKQTLGSLAIPANGLIPPGLMGYDATSSGPMPSPRQDSGDSATPAIQLTAAVHPVFFGELAAVAQKIWTAYAAKGIEIKPVNDDNDGYFRLQQSGEADIIIGRWIADYPDADTFAYILKSSDGFFGKYCGMAEIDRLIASGRTESDPVVRDSIYRRIQQITAEEALLLPLFYEQVYRFMRPGVKGLSLSYWVPTVRYEELSLDG